MPGVSARAPAAGPGQLNNPFFVVPPFLLPNRLDIIDIIVDKREDIPKLGDMTEKSNNKPCIVFAPHADDAVFGCGGTILSRRKAGIEVYVVCLTDGRNSHLFRFGIKTNPTPYELAIQREKEEKKAMRALNVNEDHVIFLGIEDATLFRHKQEACQNVTQIMEQLNPSEVFIPYIGDRHPDHVATHMIMRSCLNKLAVNPSVYQYFVWAVPDLKIKDKAIVVDISKELEAKKTAILHYGSQITSSLYPMQERPVLKGEFISRFYKPEEVFLLENTVNLKGFNKLWIFTKLYFASYFLYFIKHLRYRL